MTTKQESQTTVTNAPTDNLANSILNNVFSNKSGGNEIDSSDKVLPEKSEQENADIVNSILSRLDNKKEQAAANLGVDTKEIEALPFDLSQLETEGIFLNIDTHGFGSLIRQLDWKSLGVELPENRTILISPPRVGLLPNKFRRKLMRGSSQAHNALRKYSFSFSLCETVFGTSDYKWIPWNAFEQFESEYKNACETLAMAKSEVLANYDEVLITLREDFAEIAEDSAKRLEATLEIPFDSGEYKANVVAQGMGMIPSREVIRDDLTITMRPKVIVLGSEMVAEQQKTRRLILENERIEANRQQVRLEIDAKKRIEQSKISEFEIEQKREREVKERIRQMKLEAARVVATEAVSPIKEGFEQITAKVYEAALEMTEKLHDAEFVPGSLAKRARQMCEWYRLMNFTDDTSLEDVLERLELAAGGEADSRSPAEMKAVLGDVLRAASINTKRLLDEDRISALEL